MGFFFTQNKSKKTQSKGLRNAPITKQNTSTLNRLGCAVCPLDKADVCTPKMKPTLAKQTNIYFLGDAPTKHDDEKSGKPLTGEAGKLLRGLIPDGDEAYCSFDNVIRDQPTGTPTWNAIECCRGKVTKSIEEAKPKLIVGLGPIASSWALNSTDMAGMRGRVFAIKIGNHECWFLPTFDPTFILKEAFNKERPLHSRLGLCFKLDIAKAFRLADRLPKAKVDTEAEARAGIQCFDGSGGYEALLGLLKRASKAPIKAIDLETSTLRPYAAKSAILTAAISFEDTHFSFALNHPKAKWGMLEHDSLTLKLGELLTNDTIKIAHNAPFEIEWLIKEFGKSIVNHNVWECTMMQAHFLDERKGKQWGGDDSGAVYQSLDFLCKQHFGLAYKKLFKLDKKNMADADLGETLIYNGVDTKYTLRLWKLQNKALKEQKLQDAYYEALPRQPTVAIMQHLGVFVDQAEVKRSQKLLEKEIIELIAPMNELKVVKAFIKDNKEFNPGSDKDVLKIFKDYLHRPEVIRRDESGRSDAITYSTDKNVLAKIDHPLANIIMQLRNKTKMKSTYVDCFELGVGESIWPDGKIHTSFNTTFAETGRTSSENPNAQNFPKRNDAWVRRQVIAPKGYSMVAVDYGQLEGCTGAMCTKDKYLVDALWNDYDMHMEWAEKLVHEYPDWVGSDDFSDKSIAKKYRSIAKNKLVFPAFFGATDESISGYLKVPIDNIKTVMDEFWSTFTGFRSWQEKLMKRYYDTGLVASPTGRLHRYPLTRNQAINFPIQSVACDIVCRTMNDLSYKAVRTNQWHLHPHLNIHDDLTFFIPDDDKLLEESIEQICKIMLTPDYDFINVPLSVEVSVGKNWAPYDKKTNPQGMAEVGKFWSNKDI